MAAEKTEGMSPYERKLRKMRGEKIPGEDGGRPENLRDWKIGDNHWRFFSLPGRDSFYEEVAVHWGWGPPFKCLTRKFFGKNSNIPGDDTQCPLCQRFNRKRRALNKKYERDSEEGKAAYRRIAKEWGPRVQYYAVGYDPTADEIEVEACGFGPQLLEDLLDEYVKRGNRFFHSRKGMSMVVIKKQVGKEKNEIKYSARPGEREDVSEIYQQVKGQLLELLESVLPAEKSAEEMEEMVANSEVSYGEDDEGEGARTKVGKRKAADEEGRPPCFGDPDVHDPEDEVCEGCPHLKACAKVVAKKAASGDDGEGEEDEPKKKLAAVKSKLAAKAKEKVKRRAPAEDEDVEEEESGDDDDDE